MYLTKLLEILEDISGRKDNGRPVDVVGLDIQKAFNKVLYKRITILDGAVHEHGFMPS